MRDNLCGVLARFYQKCNNEGFLSSPNVSLYLVEGVPPKYTLEVTRKNKYEYVLLEKKMQISKHEDPLSGQHRGNGVVEYVEEVEAPEWHTVIGQELHPHIYEFMPQRYVCCLINWRRLLWRIGTEEVKKNDKIYCKFYKTMIVVM